MGMGEPFLNYDGNCSRRRSGCRRSGSRTATTISTVGWMPGLTRFVDEVEAVRLALSIHAADPGCAPS